MPPTFRLLALRVSGILLVALGLLHLALTPLLSRLVQLYCSPEGVDGIPQFPFRRISWINAALGQALQHWVTR